MREPDIEVVVTFLTTEEGGRYGPVFSGYRPNHLIMDNYLTSGEHEYIGKNVVHPGESVNAFITFIAPEYYAHTLWVGRIINVQETSLLVGHAKVTKIVNKKLELER